MDETLSITEVAERTGATPEDLHAWQARGLLAAIAGGRLPAGAVERVGLIRLLLRRGIGLDDVVAWAATGEMDRHLALIAPPPGRLHTIAEAAVATGLSEELVRLFADVIELAPRRSPVLHDEDLDALRCFRPAIAAGLPADAVAQLGRVFLDAMRRVAETESYLFHFHVRRVLRQRGLSGAVLDAAVWKASAELEPLDEPALRYFHRRALRGAIADMAALAIAERVGIHAVEAEQGVRATVAFVDLASFTPLAEAMGDEQAVEVLVRFAAMVREAAQEWDGHVVKQIGDAFMLVFPDARHAVPAMLAMERRSSTERHFPALRAGVNAGPMRFQAGEYVGTTVNVAARLADAAARHQILVGPEVRRAAGDLADVAFRPAGTRQLKGMAEPIEVYEVVSASGAAPPRLVDPVCGMELSPEEVSVRLSSAAGEVAFCSRECLRRYVARQAAE